MIKTDKLNLNKNININSSKGVTLITLVITLVILLILSVISVVAIIGRNGITNEANKAKIDQEKSEVLNKVDLAVTDATLMKTDASPMYELSTDKLNTSLSYQFSDNTYTLEELEEASGWKLTVTAQNAIHDIKIDLNGNITYLSIQSAPFESAKLITFDANGGTGSMEAQSISSTNLNLVSSSSLQRDGMEFYKWNTSSDGTGTWYDDGASVSFDDNITLYAIWAGTWKQPSVTSNQSNGEITCSSNYGSHYAYYAFDGKLGADYKWLSNGSSNGWLQWHLPKKIKITSFKLYATGESSYGKRAPKTIQLLGSNDGSNWNTVAEYENTSSLLNNNYIEINSTSPDFYEYYKWNFPNGNLGDWPGIAVGNIQITATVLKYGAETETAETWEQPSVTSNQSDGEITCSSNYGSHYAYYAFDGKLGADYKWLSNGSSNGWLQWHLLEKIKITSFKLYATGESGYGGRTPKTIQLLGSNDGSNWNTVAEYENTSYLTNNSYIEINSTSPDFYEYYKWNFPNGNLGDSIGIAVGNIQITANVSK